MPNFSGIWTVTQQMQAKGASTWPATPGAPTIGTATAGSGLCASVTFTAPACTGYPAGVTGYRVISTPGCFSNTGASSPIVVSGLSNGTSYTFKAQATNATGYGALSCASNSITASNAGSQSYTTAGTYSWVAPSGVTSVAVVAVGGGGGGNGSGAGLGYKNNYSVSAGSSYTVVVGAAGFSCPATSGGNSYFVSTAVVKGGGGGGNGSGVAGTYTGDGGGNGGVNAGGGGAGGGAGGYSGNGGKGGNCSCAPTAGSGGGGGGGYANGGGGVGIYGQGSSGAAGTCGCRPGKGGSGGQDSVSGVGGTYGGGAQTNRSGGGGAVRIIWPGNTRSFPSTCTGNP